MSGDLTAAEACYRSNFFLPFGMSACNRWFGAAAVRGQTTRVARRGRVPSSETTSRSFSQKEGEPQNNNNKSPASCDVVQGPSLLRTAVHRPRPSLLYLPGLRALPFWTQTSDSEGTKVAYQEPALTWAVTLLEQHWPTLLEEYQQAAPQLPSDYQVDTEHQKLHEGTWDWHSYMRKGQCDVHSLFAQHFPKTTDVLQQVRNQGLLFEGTPFGYAFFSTLHPHSRIAAHSAPMNWRLRVHLPLIVPEACGIRVGPTTRCWHPGKALVLDDSYEHEVWNETTSQQRVVFLVDLWHPDVTVTERRDIQALFEHAKQQGWWSSPTAPSSTTRPS